MGKLVTLVEYAQIHGTTRAAVFGRVRRNEMKTVQKLGRDLFLDADEEWLPPKRSKYAQQYKAEHPETEDQ